MSLLPAKYNFQAWEGATWRKTITLLQTDLNSAPQDLTGYTAIMNVRTAPDTAPVYTLSTTNSQIVLGGINGTIALFIPAADTLTFAWQFGIYDLNITATSGNGDISPILWGSFAMRGVA